MKALIKYYFHLDADKMDEEELAKNWNELKWVLEFTKPGAPKAS